jgi:hypothetical protein
VVGATDLQELKEVRAIVGDVLLVPGIGDSGFDFPKSASQFACWRIQIVKKNDSSEGFWVDFDATHCMWYHELALSF